MRRNGQGHYSSHLQRHAPVLAVTGAISLSDDHSTGGGGITEFPVLQWGSDGLLMPSSPYLS